MDHGDPNDIDNSASRENRPFRNFILNTGIITVIQNAIGTA